MKAAIYARYSSENQRPQSIEDQISTCRKFAIDNDFSIDENQIYSDEAKSGASNDRHGLNSLSAAARDHQFQIVLVDDLSRLARNNFLTHLCHFTPHNPRFSTIFTTVDSIILCFV